MKTPSTSDWLRLIAAILIFIAALIALMIKIAEAYALNHQLGQ